MSTPSSVHRRVHSDWRAPRVKATKWLGTLVLQAAGSEFQLSTVSVTLNKFLTISEPQFPQLVQEEGNHFPCREATQKAFGPWSEQQACSQRELLWFTPGLGTPFICSWFCSLQISLGCSGRPGLPWVGQPRPASPRRSSSQLLHGAR
jgi:hypothetical protein